MFVNFDNTLQQLHCIKVVDTGGNDLLIYVYTCRVIGKQENFQFVINIIKLSENFNYIN